MGMNGSTSRNEFIPLVQQQRHRVEERRGGEEDTETETETETMTSYHQQLNRIHIRLNNSIPYKTFYYIHNDTPSSSLLSPKNHHDSIDTHTSLLTETVRNAFFLADSTGISLFYREEGEGEEEEVYLPLSIPYLTPNKKYTLQTNFNKNKDNRLSTADSIVSTPTRSPIMTASSSSASPPPLPISNPSGSSLSSPSSWSPSSSPPLRPGYVIAMWPYTARSIQELSFSAGEEINVLGILDEQWAKGLIGNKKGYFPVNFVRGMDNIQFEDAEDEDGYHCILSSSSPSASSTLPSKHEDYQDFEYFESYSNLVIHHQMLSDHPRTQCYKDAIQALAPRIRDKIVLDIGVGSGILSIFCAKAGAKMVIGVDASDIIGMATQEVVDSNGLGDKIKLLTGKIEDLSLPLPAGHAYVDVIVSEWMGTYLVCESMIDSVLWAGRKYLDPVNGLMMPSYSTLFIQPVEDIEYYRKHVNYWSDVYGVDMSCLREKAKETFFTKPLYQETLDKGKLRGNGPNIIRNIDMHNYSDKQLEYSTAPIHFIFDKEGYIHGFSSWFDVDFHCNRQRAKRKDKKIEREKQVRQRKKEEYYAKIIGMKYEQTGNEENKEGNEGEEGEEGDLKEFVLDTSPSSPPTHWKQVTFLLSDPLVVREGQEMFGTVTIRRNKTYRRHFETTIEYLIEDNGIYGDLSEREKEHNVEPLRDIINPSHHNANKKYNTIEKDGKRYIQRKHRWDLWR